MMGKDKYHKCKEISKILGELTLQLFGEESKQNYSYLLQYSMTLFHFGEEEKSRNTFEKAERIGEKIGRED